MKRILAMLLAVVMLTSLVACGNASDTDETDAATDVATEAVETRTPSNVPAGTTFNGETYTISYFTQSCRPEYLTVDEMTGDNMNDAVYRRARNVEKALDVKMTIVDDFIEPEEFKQLYKAGDDVYQELHFHLITNVADFATEGYLYPVENLPYMDISAEWYNQEQMDALRMGKYTYYIVSDYTITNPAAVLFNREMVVDNNLSDPYELVKAGTWTMDKMIQMAIDVRQDKNGDGEYTSEDDIYGIGIGEVSVSSPYMAGAGQLLGTRDAETGKYKMTMNNEYTYAALDQLYRLFENPGSVNFQVVDFAYGTTLFNLGKADWIEAAADITEFTLGVVPFPKLNESQEQYYSVDRSGLMAIPASIKNPELVSAVQEQLAWESGNEVIDVYYNKLLKTRYASDPDTRAMVELIFDTVTYDVLGNYFGFKDGFVNLFYLSMYPIHMGQTNYAALFRAWKGHCAQTLQTFYEALEKVEGTAEAAE